VSHTRVMAAGVAALVLAACSGDPAGETPTALSDPQTSGGLPVLATARIASPAVKPAPGQFSITLRFINQPTDIQATRFEDAKAKWESIISGDVPSVTGVIPARACGNSFKTPTFSGTIDDILIDVLLQPIDGPGAVLGASGPCLVRSSDNLTVYGIMYFDTADLDFLESLGFFDEVVVHEMGHVLGFGTLWNFNRSLLADVGTTDPRFTGPLAIAAYDKLGGSGTVPVEGDEGGAGTLYSHWDEATFYNELMTGFLNGSADANPLSNLSVAAMGDLGYVVNLGSGDRYQLPRSGGPNLAVQGAAGPRGLDLARGELLVRPTMVVK
jgi:leishmanolysin